MDKEGFIIVLIACAFLVVFSEWLDKRAADTGNPLSVEDTEVNCQCVK